MRKSTAPTTNTEEDSAALTRSNRRTMIAAAVAVAAITVLCTQSIMIHQSSQWKSFYMTTNMMHLKLNVNLSYILGKIDISLLIQFMLFLMIAHCIISESFDMIIDHCIS